MLTVHHLEQSRSFRLIWMLEEMGLEYEIAHYKRDPKTMLADPALQQLHPLGKAPVLTDGEVVVAESGAILTYLVEKTGQMCPDPGTEAWRRYTYYLHYPEGSLMPFLTMKLVFNRVANAPVPFFLRPVVRGIDTKVTQQFLGPNIRRHTAFLEQEIAGRDWWAGDQLSAADIQMSYPVLALTKAVEVATPNLDAWMKRIEERPAYQRALELGGEPLPAIRR